ALSASTLPDTSSPTAPFNLSPSAATDITISLSWSAATDDVGVDHYTVYRGTTPLGPVTGTTFTDTGRAAITSYTYTVTAWDKAGNQGPASSPALSASTLADTIPPTAPTTLSKSGATDTTISLSWTAAGDDVGVDHYTVYRGATALGTVTGTKF